jgi:hypothetical protein
MDTMHTTDGADATRRNFAAFGVVLILAGLVEHLLAARAIGGGYIAFRDHIFGFILITLVFGAVIFGLGWRFWKGRRDISLLILGAVNFLLGFYVYLQRFHVHG